MKRTKIVLVLIALVLFKWCDDVAMDECLTPDPYGFWSGLWHGWIAFFSFIGSLFSDDIAMYAVNNNGAWYDFGFWLGIGSIGAGSRGRK